MLSSMCKFPIKPILAWVVEQANLAKLKSDHFNSILLIGLAVSVTRLDDLLHFGQLFKACGNNYLTQISHILRQFL